jgi:hypothetical protein
MQDRPVDDGTLSRLAAEGALVAYFGYGSLVNRETLRTHIVGARPARVSGWRREWQPRPDPGLAADRAVHASLLTVRPAPESEIDGLLVFDHVDNLAAVDLRENDYQRRHVPLETLTVIGDGVPDGCPVYIYEADPPEESPEECPILQSYLDAVLKGFLREHGLEGLKHFIRGTANFDTPILGDRDWPIYPRAVSLSSEDRALFDRLLQENGARYVA